MRRLRRRDSQLPLEIIADAQRGNARVELQRHDSFLKAERSDFDGGPIEIDELSISILPDTNEVCRCHFLSMVGAYLPMDIAKAVPVYRLSRGQDDF